MLNAAVVEHREFAASHVAIARAEPKHAEPARIALLGAGTVGKALLARFDALADSSLTQRLQLVYIANSRHALHARHGLGGEDVAKRLSQATQASALDQVASTFAGDGTRIVIDATASDVVADHHAQWLAQGIHVVTACKLGQGTALARWNAIRAGCAQGDTQYGDSATVGAGLPLLRSLRELQAGGDRIHAIAGVLSGSLAWLFNRYDGMRPFSALVRQAREAGYTEPDPREDLSGEDLRRKLLILARASGYALEAEAVEVASLVPQALASTKRDELDEVLPLLDAPLRERYAQAYRNGEKLRFIARLERNDDGDVRARVGLESLPPDHPLAGGAGTDNRVAIWSDRYREQPLVIQGPGAGAEVTAAALLDDVLRIANA
jgi:homoserine dehydrogenase